MNLEPQIILLWGNLFLSLAAVAGHIKNWMSSGEKKLTEKQGEQAKTQGVHERKLTEHDRRIQALEGEFKHLPSKEDIHALTLAVETMKGELGKMGATYDGVNRTVRRIEEYLLEERPKHDR